MFKVQDCFEQLVAAEVHQSGADIAVCLITPFQRNDDRTPDGRFWFRWGDGPGRSYARFTDQPPAEGEARILHVYGDPTGDDFDRVVAEKHFLQTFYPPVSAAFPQDSPPAGWLSPKGIFFPAHYGDHDGSARAIVAKQQDRLLPATEARELLLIDWLLLRRPTAVHGRAEKQDMTPAQANSLHPLVALAEAGDENFFAVGYAMHSRSTVCAVCEKKEMPKAIVSVCNDCMNLFSDQKIQEV